MTTPVECPECEGEGCDTCSQKGLLGMADEDAKLIDRIIGTVEDQ